MKKLGNLIWYILGGISILIILFAFLSSTFDFVRSVLFIAKAVGYGSVPLGILVLLFSAFALIVIVRGFFYSMEKDLKDTATTWKIGLYCLTSLLGFIALVHAIYSWPTN